MIHLSYAPCAVSANMIHSRKAFYVGGRYVEDHAGNHTMQGQMYVERLIPPPATGIRPYPLIFIHGATRTGAVSSPCRTLSNDTIS